MPAIRGLSGNNGVVEKEKEASARASAGAGPYIIYDLAKIAVYQFFCVPLVLWLSME
jgi:hypothetical protein